MRRGPPDASEFEIPQLVHTKGFVDLHGPKARSVYRYTMNVLKLTHPGLHALQQQEASGGFDGQARKVAAHHDFHRFVGMSVAGLVLLLATWLPFPFLWKGEVLWNIGSYLVLISVLQIRYYDTYKMIEHGGHRMFDGPGQRPPLERVFSWLWLVGSMMLVVHHHL